MAVAANFNAAIQALEPRFEEATGHDLRISTGSTGKLFAQIRNGAPFDAFLAADARRPRLLEEAGTAVDDSRFTYAVGRLALWSPDPDRVRGKATLAEGDFRHLAMANPRTAPYGLAARQALQALDRWADLRDRIVRGENIAQAHQYAASGAAELGLVALAQVSGPEAPEEGSRWVVPGDLHEPIRQQAVLLDQGAGNAAARAFLEFLQGPEAREILADFGYDPGP
ncbi:MAG: molybdate ABC transporter substrate-binding protein [Thiohalorhabdus sp.]|uniref:molybdate ABC transporter substrate-binding protein n=1 Tax=Thiohalorhabdus sp. TaxID=3094134 RepID=UPI00397F9F89